MRANKTSPRTALSTSCTTHIVQDGMTSTIFVLLPILAQAFGFTYAQVGLLKGLKSLLQAVFEIFSGWMSEKIGEFRLIVVGLVCSGAGYLLLSSPSNEFWVAVYLLIVGVGTALHHAPSSALIANSYSPSSRSSALGLYNASGDVGKLVFTGCFSLALWGGFAWQQTSLLFGLVAVTTAIGIAAATRSSMAQNPLKTHVEPDRNAPYETRGWGVLDWRSFNALLLVTGIDTMVQTTVLVFASFLMLSKGLSLTLATAATVLLLAGGVFGKAGCGYISDRIGVRSAFALIQILTAIGLIALVLVPNWLAFALLIPLGAVVQGTSSITYGFAANLIDQQKMARGYGLLYSSGTFASAAGPLIMGMVADKFGIEVTIYATAIIAVLAVPPLFFLRAASTKLS